MEEGDVKKTASFTDDAKFGAVANLSERRGNTEEQKEVINTEGNKSNKESFVSKIRS